MLLAMAEEAVQQQAAADLLFAPAEEAADLLISTAEEAAERHFATVGKAAVFCIDPWTHGTPRWHICKMLVCYYTRAPVCRPRHAALISLTRAIIMPIHILNHIQKIMTSRARHSHARAVFFGVAHQPLGRSALAYASNIMRSYTPRNT